MKIPIIILLFISTISTVTCNRYNVPINHLSIKCGPEQTKLNEGRKPCCYYDTKNVPTIGIGFNLKRSDAADLLEKHGFKLEDVLQDCKHNTTKHCINDQAIDYIFEKIHYPEAEKIADRYVPNLPEQVRAAIIDLAFNLGESKLNQFNHLKAGLQIGYWSFAAKELKNALWCGQVGSNRCNSNYNCIAGEATNEGSCSAGSCSEMTNTCSSNPNCYCYKTTDGNSLCSSGSYCDEVDDCIAKGNSYSCASKTAECVLASCCGVPKCIPIESSKDCVSPPSTLGSQFNKLMRLSRQSCNNDADCENGTSCRLHSTGSFCE